MRFTVVLFLPLLIPSISFAGQLEDGKAAFDSKDYQTALKLLRPLAEKGTPQAEYTIGQMYENGLGMSADVIEAMKWYSAARKQGFPKEELKVPPKVDFKKAPPEVNAEAEKRLREAFAAAPYKLDGLMAGDKSSKIILGPFLSGSLDRVSCKGTTSTAGLSKLEVPFPVHISKEQLQIFQSEMALIQPVVEKLSDKKMPPVDVAKNLSNFPPIPLYAAKNAAERKVLAALLNDKIKINARPSIRAAKYNELAQEMIWKRRLDHLGEKEKLKINEPIFVIDDGLRKYLFNFYPDGKSLYWIEDVTDIGWFPLGPM